MAPHKKNIGQLKVGFPTVAKKFPKSTTVEDMDQEEPVFEPKIPAEPNTIRDLDHYKCCVAFQGTDYEVMVLKNNDEMMAEVVANKLSGKRVIKRLDKREILVRELKKQLSIDDMHTIVILNGR